MNPQRSRLKVKVVVGFRKANGKYHGPWGLSGDHTSHTLSMERASPQTFTNQLFAIGSMPASTPAGMIHPPKTKTVICTVWEPSVDVDSLIPYKTDLR